MMNISKSTIIGIGVNLFLSAALVYLLYTNPSVFFSGHTDRSPIGSPPRYKVAFVQMEATESSGLVQEGIRDRVRRPDDSSLIDLQILDANGDKMRLQAIIEKAIDDGVDLFVPFGTIITQLVKELTIKRASFTKTVFCGTGDPVKAGIIQVPGKPLEHLTGFGVSGFGFVEPMINQLPLLAPHVKKILMPYNPTSLGGTLEEYRQYIGTMLEKRGYVVTDVKIFNTNDIAQKLQSFITDVDMVWILPDATLIEGMDAVARLCERHQKCSYVTMNLNQLSHGAALAFGYSLYEVGLDVGDYIVRILEKGERIKDLPVMPITPARFKVGINIENAQAQGLLRHIDPTILYFMEHGMIFKDAL
jgi:putative ABC transport system substrate-binding protein